MKILFLVAIISLIISFFADKRKTGKALKIAWKKFSGILPRFLTMISFLAVFSTIVPISNITKMLDGQSPFIQLLIALLLGSIVFVPGFIAFPLAAVLVKNGVPYYVVAAFTSSLMLVGFASMPVEAAYFGKKQALWRNIVCVITSFLIAICIAIFYGEF